MLFSSIDFIFIFLPITIIGFHFFSKLGRSYGLLHLTAASLFFYAYWRFGDLIVLIASVCANFIFAQLIANGENPKRRRLTLYLGIASNIALLIWYKYIPPFFLAINPHPDTIPTWVHVALPLGISFFTLTQIAYLVDLSQGEARSEKPLHYLLFVTFFPHLIAGPIVHHAEIMKQLKESGSRGIDPQDFCLGATWFVLGLSKKTIIADPFGAAADVLFSHATSVSATGAWIGTLSYSVQLYFDFSGYSDMALGLARIFSIRFPINFNSPYQARSIIEFWSRWHMTLTRFITVYIYNPFSLHLNRRRILKGKKLTKNTSRTLSGFLELVAVPTMFTMLVAGVWHGAGLQYLVFGALHGAYLIVNHAWRIISRNKRFEQALIRPVAVGLTYLAVVVAQVFFRADNVSDAATILKGLLDLHPGTALALADENHSAPSRAAALLHPPYAIMALLVSFVIIWLLPNTQQLLGQQIQASPTAGGGSRWFTWSPNWAWLSCTLALFTICYTLLDSQRNFLYFQF